MRLSTAIANSPALTSMYSNPLDKFKTYSYHHIWVVGNTTDTVTQALNDNASLLSLIQGSGKEAGGYRIINNGLCVLVNGTKDSDFSIERLVFEAVAVGQKVSAGANTLPSLTGTIELLEPQGVRLLNVLREVYNSLGVLNVNAIHALKTIFVGAVDGGVTHTIEYVTTIPPILFVMSDLKMSVTNQGSVYVFEFTHISSVASTPAVSQSGKGVLLRMGGTINAELQSIADQYTNHSLDNAESISDPKIQKKPIKYKIKLDDTIAEIGDWVVTEEKAIRTEGNGKTNSLSLNGNVPIERAIELVITGSKQYLDQFLAKNESSFTFMVVPIYYINSAHEPEVLYRITKNPIGKVVRLNETSVKNPDADPTTRFGSDARVLVYDYIFTGKNTDIEQLDMRIDEGLAFLRTVTSTQNISQTPTKKNVSKDGIVASSSTAYLVDPNDTKPLKGSVGPPRTSSSITGKQHGLDQRKIQYDEVLQHAFALEAAKMGMLLTIRGNPGFISCFALQPTSQRDMGSVGNPDPRSGFSSTIYSDLPLICVNIMMPTSWTTAAGSRYDPEMEPYWYRGLWQLMKVTTMFVGGKFSQELTLMAVPSFPATDTIERVSTPDGVIKPTPSRNGEVTPTQPRPATQPGNGSGAGGTTPSTPPSSTPRPPQPATPTSPQNGKFLLGSTDYTTRITKDYTLGEMLKTSHAKWQQGENNPPTQAILDNIVNTLENMQKIREALKAPCLISSGYRSPPVNAAVGGASSSDHMQGMACDFSAPAYGTPADVVAAIVGMGIPFKQLILERPPNRKPWVHIAFSRSPSGNKGDLKVYNGKAYTPYSVKG